MSDLSAGKRAVTRKSAIPVYAIGLTWLLWAKLLPLYAPVHFLICAAVSAAVFFLLNALIPGKTVYLEVKEPDVVTGNEEADELIRTGKTTLSAVAAAANTIKEETVRQKFHALDVTSRRILDYIAKKPETAGNLRKFFNYYLPTLQKLAETYALMEKQGVEGSNLNEGMTRIEKMLDTMDGAFKKQLDALFGETTLDITTDISVMESLMAQEGLTEGKNQLKMDDIGGTQL